MAGFANVEKYTRMTGLSRLLDVVLPSHRNVAFRSCGGARDVFSKEVGMVLARRDGGGGLDWSSGRRAGRGGSPTRFQLEMTLGHPALPLSVGPLPLRRRRWVADGVQVRRPRQESRQSPCQRPDVARRRNTFPGAPNPRDSCFLLDPLTFTSPRPRNLAALRGLVVNLSRFPAQVGTGVLGVTEGSSFVRTGSCSRSAI